MRILGCIKLTNMALGSIMFAEIGSALINLAINAYFICSVYTLFVGGTFYWVVLSFVIVNVILFINATYKVVNLTVTSEALNAELNLAKDAIQNYQVYILSQGLGKIIKIIFIGLQIYNWENISQYFGF